MTLCCGPGIRFADPGFYFLHRAQEKGQRSLVALLFLMLAAVVFMLLDVSAGFRRRPSLNDRLLEAVGISRAPHYAVATPQDRGRRQ